MAEAAIAWLDYVKAEPGMGNIRQRFMTDVAPTEGCQAIIHHWERFRDWDEETFLTFILEALREIPTDRDLENEDGSLTSFGMRRKLWTYALNNTMRLRPQPLLLQFLDLINLVHLKHGSSLQDILQGFPIHFFSRFSYGIKILKNNALIPNAVKYFSVSSPVVVIKVISAV
jgi:hypothetical protein